MHGSGIYIYPVHSWWTPSFSMDLRVSEFRVYYSATDAIIVVISLLG